MIAPHQQQFSDTSRAYDGLYHCTGSGKTRTAIYTVRAHAGSILVVAPKTSVQKGQWVKEAEKLGITPPVVISKETFRSQALMLPRYDAVIFDEAHHILGVTPNTRRRNKKVIPKASQLFECALWYVKTHAPKRVILATATPNKTPMSVWAAAKLIGLSWDWYQFRDDFYFRLPMDREVWAPYRDDDAVQRLGEKTRETGQTLRLDDIREVPEQIFKKVSVSLTKEQIEAKKKLYLLTSNPSRQKYHEIENGILYLDEFNQKTGRVERKTVEYANEKVEHILELATEFPKMVIFANYSAQVEMIAKALEDAGKQCVLRLTGKTENRGEIEVRAEQSESAYIVAQASVSSEWEFKTCPVMVFASMSNRSVDHIQGLGRIQRYDHIKRNIYIYLVADDKGCVDSDWYDTIQSGKDFNDAMYSDI
jgi:hypothetical protein